MLQPCRIWVPTQAQLSAGPALTCLLSLLPFKGEEAFALIFVIVVCFFFFLPVERLGRQKVILLSPSQAKSAGSLVWLPWGGMKHFGRAGPPVQPTLPEETSL